MTAKSVWHTDDHAVYDVQFWGKHLLSPIPVLIMHYHFIYCLSSHLVMIPNTMAIYLNMKSIVFITLGLKMLILSHGSSH